jgi:hypothetical protein
MALQRSHALPFPWKLFLLHPANLGFFAPDQHACGER